MVRSVVDFDQFSTKSRSNFDQTSTPQVSKFGRCFDQTSTPTSFKIDYLFISKIICISIVVVFVARALEPSPWRRIWGDHAGKARGGVSGRKRPRHRGGAIRPDGRCAQREKGKGGECPGWRSEPNIGTVAGEARKRRWKRARLLGAVLAASRRSLLDCHVAGLLGADGARGGGSPKS